eukprot:COSAG02_NODE_563_length_20290_cov_23.664108_10_plen_141_part_00
MCVCVCVCACLKRAGEYRYTVQNQFCHRQRYRRSRALCHANGRLTLISINAFPNMSLQPSERRVNVRMLRGSSLKGDGGVVRRIALPQALAHSTTSSTYYDSSVLLLDHWLVCHPEFVFSMNPAVFCKSCKFYASLFFIS